MPRVEQVLDKQGSWLWSAPGVPAESLLVFVHGYTGHPRATWQRFPDLVRIADSGLERDIDVLSIGYRTSLLVNTASLAVLAEGVATILDAHASDRQRIYFVAHSLGGILVRAALTACASKSVKTRHSIVKATRQLHFIGVPTPGVWFLPDFITRWLWFNRIAQSLPRNGRLLAHALRDYQEAMQLVAGNLPTTFHFVGAGDHVAPHNGTVASALPGEEVRVVSADHIGIAKPTGPNDSVFMLVTRAIRVDLATRRIEERPGRVPTAPRLPAQFRQQILRLKGLSPEAGALLLGLSHFDADRDPLPLPALLVWTGLTPAGAADALTTLQAKKLVNGQTGGLRLDSAVLDVLDRLTYADDFLGRTILDRSRALLKRVNEHVTPRATN